MRIVSLEGAVEETWREGVRTRYILGQVKVPMFTVIVRKCYGVAGGGFGAGFLGALRSVVPLALSHERAGLMSAFYVLSYLAFCVPSLLAGNLHRVIPRAAQNIEFFADWALTLQETIGNVSTTIMSWNPNELNVALTSSNINENVVFSSAGMLFSDFVTLTAGRTYKLGINQASNSVASEVPEPGSMVLVALGLFALGAASRRKAGK